MFQPSSVVLGARSTLLTARETGFRVRQGDGDGAVRALRSALEAPESAGDAARQRILDNFLIARRESELLRTIAEVLG